MYVAMDEILGFKNPHEPEKTLESLVAFVFFVMNTPGGRVGEEYVKKPPAKDAVKKQGGKQLQHSEIHP